MSLLEVLVKGGWMMIPITAASVAVIALGIGRYLALKKISAELNRFVLQWRDTPAGADGERFRNACKSGPAAVRRMGDAAARTGRGRDAELAVEGVARGEMNGAETGLGTMATLAAVSPLMGFLGTVTGMIRAFMQIQNLGGNVNANVLAGGIWEALVTTAAGLAVGILALVIHNYLSGLVKSIVADLETAGDLIIKFNAGANDET